MRLIDADALIKQQYEILGCDPMYYQGLEASKSQYLIEFLERAQTVDAVPVVRCKECKYKEQARVNKKGFLVCPASGMEITDGDFCSYGERRESEAGE
jgi:hypothetical protein